MRTDICIYCGENTEERILEAKLRSGSFEFIGTETVDYCPTCEVWFRDLSTNEPCCLEQAEAELRKHLRDAADIRDVMRAIGARLDYRLWNKP